MQTQKTIRFERVSPQYICLWSSWSEEIIISWRVYDTSSYFELKAFLGGKNWNFSPYWRQVENPWLLIASLYRWNSSGGSERWRVKCYCKVWKNNPRVEQRSFLYDQTRTPSFVLNALAPDILIPIIFLETLPKFFGSLSPWKKQKIVNVLTFSLRISSCCTVVVAKLRKCTRLLAIVGSRDVISVVHNLT